MNDRFFNLSLDILCIVDTEGTFVRVNPAFCNILGFSEEELKSKKTFDLIHPDDLQASSEACAGILDGHEASSFINRYKSRDGSIHFISWVTKYVPEENLVYASGRDVTQKIRHEEKINETLYLLNYTGSIAKVGGWEFIVDSNTTYWTDETYKILDLDQETGVIPSIEEIINLFVGQYKPIYEAAVHMALNEGLPYDLELKMKTFKDQEIWVFVSGRTIVENGKVTHLSGVIQNIDEKKKAEELLEREYQKNFLQSRLASIGELAAGVGHEINNPLTISMGYLDRLKKMNDLPPEVYKTIKNIEVGHDRIRNITNGLRGLSRTETGKTIFNLEQVIDDFILFVQKIYELQNITLEFVTTAHHDVNIFANRTEIQQVIMNLISNAKDAIKDVESKKIYVNLSTHTNENTNAHEVLLKVTDNGQGIEDSHKHRIFDSFFTTKDPGEGTGLGLALVHRIISEIGGEIWFESQENVGTTFFVKLPLVTDSLVQQIPQIEESKLSHQGLKMMILDDEPGVLETLKFMLEDLGCEILAASNAKDGFSLLETDDFDVILSDIIMPEINGIDFLKMITHKNLRKDCKFLFMTGGVSQSQLLVDSSLKYDGLINKPFTEEELITAINLIVMKKYPSSDNAS